MQVVGLFAGIGGIEAGLQRAGHRAVLLCENDVAAKAVLSNRFPDVQLHDDVATLRTVPTGVDVVAAGFPCQDLSQAGRTAGITGKRSGLVEHVFRILRTSRPPWVIIENVPFMLHLDGGAAMDHVVSNLEHLGYSWAYRVVDTRSFGLPQRRRRVYLLASKNASPERLLFTDEAMTPEIANHVGRACGFYWTEGNTGLGWAVDAIPTLKGGSGLGIASPPAIWMPDDSIVVPNIRDAERLQGFEPDWTAIAEEKTKPSYRWKLIGNAVSVPAAHWLGELLNRSEGPKINGRRMTLGQWPNAAYGSQGQRYAVECTEWPFSPVATPLRDFLSFDPTLLSPRAAAGFTMRLRRSKLRYPPEFMLALEQHLESMLSVSRR